MYKKCCETCNNSFININEKNGEKILMCPDGGVLEQVNSNYFCDNYNNEEIQMNEILYKDDVKRKELIKTK